MLYVHQLYYDGNRNDYTQIDLSELNNEGIYSDDLHMVWLVSDNARFNYSQLCIIVLLVVLLIKNVKYFIHSTVLLYSNCVHFLSFYCSEEFSKVLHREQTYSADVKHYTIKKYFLIIFTTESSVRLKLKFNFFFH